MQILLVPGRDKRWRLGMAIAPGGKHLSQSLILRSERWLEPNVTDDMLNNFFAFGKGTRACIAQNLGTAEVTLAIWKVVEKDMLRGARVIDNDGKGGEIQILQWFNSRVKGEEILVQWIGR